MRTLATADLKGKTVFYRADYNVPLAGSKILDDYRITSTFPTLDHLIGLKCKIIIGSHLGRPDGQVKPEFSLRPVAQRLADQYPKRTLRFAHTLDAAEIASAKEQMQPGDILLLENLRFQAGEEGNDPELAALLAGLAEAYVNDSFAADHRAHASIVGIPALIPGYAGYLVEKEVSTLTNVLKNPVHPFVVVMGGAKVSDKIEVIEQLAKTADTLLIGGAMANTFLLAQGVDIGASKAEPDKVELAKQLLETYKEKIVIASDYTKVDKDNTFQFLDIGNGAVSQFEEYLSKAKTIFWNGSLGYTQDPLYAKATIAIATFIGNLKGVTSVVAGGDTVETITSLKMHDRFTFVSTGGGAALELLAGKKLPGIEALKDNT